MHLNDLINKLAALLFIGTTRQMRQEYVHLMAFRMPKNGIKRSQGYDMCRRKILVKQHGQVDHEEELARELVR